VTGLFALFGVAVTALFVATGSAKETVHGF
jgi:hypothetical protein